MTDYSFKLLPYRKGYDHQSFQLGDRGYGFIGIKEQPNGRSVALERCPKCGRENYHASVLALQCAWCGFDAKPYIPNPLPSVPVETVND